MEEETRAPAGCRGVWGPRGWGGCPWRTRAGRRPHLYRRPWLCPAWGDWGKGSVPAPPREPPCPDCFRSRRCEKPASGQQLCQPPLPPAFCLGPGRTLAGIFPTALWVQACPAPCLAAGTARLHSLATLSTWVLLLRGRRVAPVSPCASPGAPAVLALPAGLEEPR